MRGISVRIGFACPPEHLADLAAELYGAAIIADDSAEFVRLASRAIGGADGILGDVMSHPWAIQDVHTGIRQAAHLSAEGAVRLLTRFFSQLEPEDIDAVIQASEFDNERQYLASLIDHFDEGSSEVATALADSMGISLKTLAEAIGAQYHD